MAYNGDGTEAELEIISLLERISIEQQKHTILLQEFLGFSIPDEDIEDERN